MIGLTWRQFLVQGLTAVTVLIAAASLLGATGPHLVGLYAASGSPAAKAATARKWILLLAARPPAGLTGRTRATIPDSGSRQR